MEKTFLNNPQKVKNGYYWEKAVIKPIVNNKRQKHRFHEISSFLIDFLYVPIWKGIYWKSLTFEGQYEVNVHITYIVFGVKNLTKKKILLWVYLI